MKNFVIVLFVLSLAVCAFAATDVTMTKTDNVEKYTATVPLPSVDALPAGFISAISTTISNTVPTAVGTVPSTARRMIVQANTPVFYSFSSAVSGLFPTIASGSMKVFAGAYTDLDNMYLIAPAATGTIQVLFFDE